MGDGATTIHSNDIAVMQDRMHQFGGGLGHRLDPVSGVVAVGGDRISVLQRVLALQGGRQLNLDRREILYLDRARFQGHRHRIRCGQPAAVHLLFHKPEGAQR